MKFGSAGELERANAHFGFSVALEKILSRQGFSKPMSQQGLLCCNKALRLGTRPGLGVHDRRLHATGTRARLRNVRTRHSFLALCRDMDLCVTTLFPGMLGGLGRDKGFLCCDRYLLA